MPELPDVRDPKQRKRAVQGARSYAYYSGIALQMVAILLIAYYAADYLAGAFEIETPLFKAAVLLAGVGLSLYLPLRGLMKS